MEFMVHSAGPVERDGVPVGSWTVGESRTVGFMDFGSSRYEFRIVEPFGQGYAVEVRSPEGRTAKLSYNWREGYWLEGDDVRPELEFGDTVVKDGESTVGSISWTSLYVRIRIPEGTPFPVARLYVVLMGVSRLWADKVGPFAPRRNAV